MKTLAPDLIRSVRLILLSFLVAQLLLVWAQCQTLTVSSQTNDKTTQETKEKSTEGPSKKAKGLPLKSDRTIDFTTDEGTWVSLDIFPDGKTIIFELLGDLYTVPIS